MANRYFTQFFYSLLKKPVMLGGKISLDASANVSGTDLKGMSVAKTGTGEYTITLHDQYSKLYHISAGVLDSAQDLVIDFKNLNLANKTIVMNTKVAGALANITDACDIYVTLVLSNSSVD